MPSVSKDVEQWEVTCTDKESEYWQIHTGDSFYNG